MSLRFAFVLVGLIGCSNAATRDPVEPPTTPTPTTTLETATPTPAPTPTPTATTDGKVSVAMTAATLAENCGAAPTAPERKPAKPVKSKAKADMSFAKARRRCEQTSMQLSIAAPAGAASELHVKKVELFDETGKLIGELATGSPTVWTQADAYKPWDQRIVPEQTLSVSYPLSHPDWSAVADRQNMTFTLKAVITVGGADQTVEKGSLQEQEISAPSSLPAGVKT